MTNEPSDASAQPQPEPNAASNSPESASQTDAQPPAPTQQSEQPTPTPPSTGAADDQGSPSGPALDASAAQAMSSANDAVLAKIQIGSRRNRSEQEPSSSKPEIAKPIEPIKVVNDPAPAGPIPTPSVRDPLSPELEAQFAAAMGDVSLDEMLVGGVTGNAAATLEQGAHVKTAVARIHGDNVFFSLGGRNEGVASLRQFPEPPTLGAELEVVVKSYSADDGIYEVAIPGASTQVDDWEDLVEGTVVEARITGSNAGGLECKVSNLRGFIPASQIAIYHVDDFAEFVDEKMICVVTEVNPGRKNLVLSRRAILEREKEEARKQLLETLEVGQVAEGVVRKLMPFGAFVDIGGIDGLVHISQLSWDRVNDPSEVLEEGQKIRVKVEKIDTETGKIGLSYRDLLDHPWTNIDEKVTADTVIRGTVSRIAKFGAFVKLAPGVEGLIHISELSHGRVANVATVVSEGQQVDVKVLSIDPEAQRIALSIKAVLPEPSASTATEEEQDKAHETQREQLLAKRTQPLKGGTERDSGGDQFGLRW